MPSRTSPRCVGNGNPLTSSDQNTGDLLLRKPSSITFPQLGQFMATSLRKQKNTLSPSRDKVRKHSAVPLSVADPSRGSTALRLPSQADAVTGINRPNLLASSFSRRLQGDFRPSLLSALHQTAALFAGEKGVLVPFHAKIFSSPIHNITFYLFVNGFSVRFSRFSSFFHRFRLFCGFF